MQLFERGFGGNRHDVRPRSHHFADALVAEFHHLLDQVRLLRLDDAFFLRRFYKRLNALLRALLLRFFRFLLRNTRQRLRAFQEHADRPDQPHGAANQRQERNQPAAPGAV